MKNYKINTNREPLTDADISAGKDFGKLMQGYQAAKMPFFKTAKFWFGTSAVTITAAVALFMVYTKTMAPDSLPATEQATAFINPPMPEADIKREAYEVNTSADTTLFYTTGSIIHIPANAFLDANGKPVTGKIELHYREFHEAIDVLLAGIPMTYDSAGERYHFETAGMMEISATQNGKPLNTNPNAPITVDMVSSDVRDVFNTYYLDTTEKRWEYLAVSNYTGKKVQSNSIPGAAEERSGMLYENSTAIGIQQSIEDVRAEIVEMEQQKPVEPKKINKDKPRFSIKVDEKEFPEIAIYKGMKFEVVDVAKYDPAKAKIMWDDISLARVENSLNYEITFANVQSSYKVIATPVFGDKEYTEAKKVYDEKYTAYQVALKERRQAEANLKATLAENTRKLNEAMQEEIAEQERRQNEYEEKLQQSSLVYRTFQVSNFGIYNCDQPQVFPTNASVIAKFVDKSSGKELECTDVYLIEKGRNLVFTSNYNELNKVRYNPAMQNMMWLITKDMKVAIIKPAQFSSDVAGKKNAVLNMEVLNQKFKSSEEVKKYLDI